VNARSSARVLGYPQIQRLLVVVALACGGLFLLAGLAHAQDGTVVQDGNSSTGSTATSAPVTSSNTATSTSGPSASDGGRAAMVGDTNTSIDQNTSARSGPASAGSQVSRPGRGTTEQNFNSSNGATATSGPVDASSAITAHNGPFADGDDAGATMVGDGDLDISQETEGESGPARAGSQFTDTTDADDDTVIANINSCGDAATAVDCGEATSGDVVVSNTFGDPADPAPSGTGPVATGDGTTAAMVGDADAVITMVATATSGDADVGVQDTRGGGTVLNVNEAATGTATSGPVTSTNVASGFVGPFAASLGGPASSTMVGDASGDLDMTVDADSGDAHAGSQVDAPVGDEAGHRTVLNRSASEDDTAVTGAADAGNDVKAFAGPMSNVEAGGEEASARLNGDATFDITVVADATSGDSWAGGQHTRATDDAVVMNDNSSSGGEATSGDACAAPDCDDPALTGGNVVEAVSGPVATSDPGTAAAAQDGDDEVTIDLDADADTDDALVGHQLTTAEDDATVLNVNESIDDTATGGNAISGNDVTGVAGPLAAAGAADAASVQSGDDTLGITAGALSDTEEAVTGSQVTHATGDAVVANVNSSFGNTSIVSDAMAGNAVAAFAGPVAGSATLVLPLAVPEAGAFENSAAQDGDNEIVIDLTARAIAGPAYSGSQRSDVDDGTVLNTNTAEDSTSQGLAACASPLCLGELIDPDTLTPASVPGGNTVTLVAGPSASGDGNAHAVMNGDATAELDADVLAETGLTATSSQADIVHGDSTVENLNTSSGAFAGCVPVSGTDCRATAGNETEVFVGARAVADAGLSATAAQDGDSTLDAGGSLSADAVTGNALAGVQATDVRSGSTVQNDNTATDPQGIAGSATSYNGLGVDPFGLVDNTTIVGASAQAIAADASAALSGDSELDVDMEVSSGSGDALSGVQVTVFHRAGTAQETNDSTADSAESGSALVFNLAAGLVGASAIDATGVAGVGDHTLDLDQLAEGFSDDALSGTQVIDDSGITDFTVVVISALDAGDDFGSQDADGDFAWSSGGFVGRGHGAVAA
jgi:hypothetical protein